MALVWNEYIPRQNKALTIAVCPVCSYHHWHYLNIDGTCYVQCGRCKEIYRT